MEVAYQAATFHGRGLTAPESMRWDAALNLGARARREIRWHPLKYYADALETVRGETLGEFACRGDERLAEETPFWESLPANNRFKWFLLLLMGSPGFQLPVEW